MQAKDVDVLLPGLGIALQTIDAMRRDDQHVVATIQEQTDGALWNRHPLGPPPIIGRFAD